MSGKIEWRDASIGTVLLILPFVIFFVMFSFWPSPGSSALENWQKATRDIVTFTAQQETDQKVVNDAVADKQKTDAATDQVKQTRAQLVTSATAALEKTKGQLADAQTRQDTALAAVKAGTGDTGKLSEEARLCLLVVLAGALGASISAARGFAFHFGDKDYDASWRWWYALRIPTGCGIAFVLYAVLRAGLVPWKLDKPSEVLDQINPYGFVAIGALGGMFANEAFQKLQAVLSAILSVGVTSASGTKPEISGVTLTQTGDRKGITIAGTNFTKGASVKVGGETWTIDAASVKANELKAKGNTDLASPPAAIEIVLTVPGPPQQSTTWNGTAPA